jgi:regulator of sigma E protease
LIGGFVKFPDDVEKGPQPGDLRAAPIKSRLLTIAAGPVMNVILAVIITVVLLMTAGDVKFVVQDAVQGTPAYEAGLREGDVITRYNGVRLDFSYDWQDASGSALGEELPLEIDRGGEKLKVGIPSSEAQELQSRNMALAERRFHFFEAVGLSFKWLGLQMREIVSALGKLFFTFQGVENMAGIVGTAAVVGTAVQTSYKLTLMLVALISVNLAIINLLPIPALDGGKLVMYAIEAGRRKPVSERVEGILNLIGMAVIMGLAVFLVIQDVGRLLPGG